MKNTLYLHAIMALLGLGRSARAEAAQFFKIENQLNAALDLQVAATLPLIK
jgi:hypothetical protein